MSDYITDLDDALQESGENVILRRIVGVTDTVNIDVTVRANVRLVRGPDELVGGIGQDDLRIIISPTQIAAAQWPGGGVDPPAPFNPDRSLPRRGDRVIVKGRMYRVEHANPMAVLGQVVRIEMITKGGALGG